ncbi:P-loop containing nucleoside triphosphate hydrolase protein [Dichotomocladium elegans]|nr:P-loop containing nucleoside triphosphate hydrolase protein [Dichotomocladium elegans]
MVNPYSQLPQIETSLAHILNHHRAYVAERKQRQLPQRPLVVGVSGCQGSGKTTLCDTLKHLLASEPHNLNVVSFSLDDFYLTRSEQAKLTEANPGNPLYTYRGQPGSHDTQLLRATLEQLLAQKPADIPSYDKSCFSGLGDRCARSEWKATRGPYDIVLFEGWSQGFKPLLESRLARVKEEASSTSISKLSLAHLEQMNRNLGRYEADLYPMFDIFIHLSPAKLEQVYQWRLQQEHHMKTTRGVEGMSDEAVRLFVDTYMPAYELYLPRLDEVGFFGQGPSRADGGYSAPSRHLKIVLDADRRVVKSELIQASLSRNVSSRPPPLLRFAPRILFACTVLGAIGFVGYNRRHRISDLFFRFAKEK